MLLLLSLTLKSAFLLVKPFYIVAAVGFGLLSGWQLKGVFSAKSFFPCWFWSLLSSLAGAFCLLEDFFDDTVSRLTKKKNRRFFNLSLLPRLKPKLGKYDVKLVKTQQC